MSTPDPLSAIAASVDRMRNASRQPVEPTPTLVPGWVWDECETRGYDWFIQARDTGAIIRNEAP